jgi:glyceraldehyde 3-phosphate dehydrogenase
MSIKLGINGFGRIGRLCFRALLERDESNVDIVGVNDLTDAETLATLLKYDTVHGQYPGDVSLDGDALVVDGDRFRVFSKKDPTSLPWGDLDTDAVIESTGVFRTREKAAMHLTAGADRVVISAPAKSEVDATVVLGVNGDVLTGDEEVVSNASCTTNCLGPLVKVLDDAFGIESGLMTTVHAYTSSQNILDGPHSDLRRARTAAESIIPTTTGAAKAVGEVLPHLDGKLDGMAMRVPTPDGSITDLTATVQQDVSINDVNEAFREAADRGPLSDVLAYSDAPIVSRDVIHDPHSCIYDAPWSMAAGSMVKVVGWYDNEWGYANRTVDLVERLVEESAS